jgi:hypothetical protein
MSDFSGRWHATFGPMELTQTGNRVDGYYRAMGGNCPVHGTVSGRRLTFTYEEPTARGEGWFDLAPHGRSFHGQWRAEGDSTWRPWVGERLGFDGVWATDFGRLRLVVEDDGRAHGMYELAGGSTIEGRVTGNVLEFTFQEPTARGEGRFELSPDGLMFAGPWRPEGAPGWSAWRGQRLLQTGLTWLVVLEVPWHALSADRDYSFGAMLREFFGRSPFVRVRQRFFSNEAALKRLCRELWLIPEPVALVVATHSLEQGIQLDGKTVEVQTFAESLRYVPELRVLHFSACLLMRNPVVVEGWRQLANQQHVAVSGYTTSVNWAASAILEFTYLEMILSHGMTPVQAAEQVRQLLTFAGDGPLPLASPFAPAGFRLVAPE